MAEVPNVVIKDPNKRELIYQIFGWVSLAVALAVGVDAASDGFDLSDWTTPALAGLGILGAGIGYTASRNTPTQ